MNIYRSVAHGLAHGVALALVMFVVGCSSTENLVHERCSDPDTGAPVYTTYEGKASYYARRFHGRKTASGVRYNMNAMTCAHRSLPFGTLLKVTNKKNGRKVVVVVNDRGPWIPDRVVDLSLAAAKELGMVRAGVVPVSVDVMAWGGR